MKQTLPRKKSRVFSLIILLISTVLVIVLVEGTLYLLKYDNAYTLMQRFSVDKADWWINDSILGPRYVKDEYEKLVMSAPNWYHERLKIVNEQGYHDRDDFTDLSSDTNSIKVLFIGDSFAWGASSDVDSSFVDVFEQNSKNRFSINVWNAAIPATGTNYALHVTKRFLPLQKSNIVVLDFFTGNDFSDNLTPFDQIQFNNKASCLNCYKLDNSFKANKISIQDAYRDATGSYPIENANLFQRKIIIRSRLIPFFNRAFNKLTRIIYQITHSGNISKEEYSFQITRTYLDQLRNYVRENDAELVVLLIPEQNDIKMKSNRYLKAIEILRELEINFLEISDNLCESSYVQSKYDGHWNNSGHKIAGTLLFEHISATCEIKNK